MRVRVRNITGNGQKMHEKCNIFINFFRNYYRILPTRPQMSKDYFFKSEKDLKNLKQGTNLSTLTLSPFFNISPLDFNFFAHFSTFQFKHFL